MSEVDTWINSARTNFEVIFVVVKSLSAIKRCLVEIAIGSEFEQLEHEQVYLDELHDIPEDSNQSILNSAILQIEQCSAKAHWTVSRELDLVLAKLKEIKESLDDGNIDYSKLRELVSEIIPDHEERIFASIRKTLQ